MKDTVELKKLRKSVVGARPINKNTNNQYLHLKGDSKDVEENMLLLERAVNYWNGLRSWRKVIERNWRYLTGEQWGDLVFDPGTGGFVKEEYLITQQGQIPFVVNMIAPLIENILGQFRASKSRATVIARTREDAPVSDMLTNTLWAIEDQNSMWEKDSAALEMFMVSGCVFQRLDWGYVRGSKRKDSRYKNVDMTTIFFNSMNDQDYDDLSMIGLFHDMSLNSVVSQFAKTKADESRIREMFSHIDPRAPQVNDHFMKQQSENKDFYFPLDYDKCRVFEVWEKRAEWRYEYHDTMRGIYDRVKMTKENKQKFDQENAQRLMLANQYGIPREDVSLIEYEEKFMSFWYFKFITNEHQTLLEGETPFEHGMPPFKFMLHRLNRGEVRPFISTLIDIQRGYNRDRILLDFVIGASAKGTFYIDEKHLAEDFHIDEAKAEYTKRNGVIRLDLKNGARINDVLGQLTSKAIPAGLNESLSMGMQLMQQMGGVSEALQGRMPGGGVPAALYAQSAQNSTLNIKDRIESFNQFRARRGKMLLDIAIQFYDDKRYLAVSGSSKTREFDRSKLRDDLVYDMSIGVGSDSQTFRAMMDDWINQYVVQGLIPLKVGLKNLSFPNIDKLVNDLEEYEASQAEMMQGQPGVNVAPSKKVDTPPNIAAALMDEIKAKGADENNANKKAMELMGRHVGAV